MPLTSAVLPAVEVGPTGGNVDGSVVWLHGLGADGHDFEPLVPMLQLPRVRFVFPHAPSMPVTINGGMVMPAWYDILMMGGVRSGEDEAGIRRSATQIEALLAREEKRGVPASRIVLAGFSQGGAMALHVGVRYPRPLRGVMVLSAYELLGKAFRTEHSPANAGTPMLFCHGKHDPMVSVDRGRAAYQAHSTGREAQWREFPIEHSVSPEEIEVIREWLTARFQA